MECFKRFRNIDSHFASKQIWKILKGQPIGGLITIYPDLIILVNYLEPA